MRLTAISAGVILATASYAAAQGNPQPSRVEVGFALGRESAAVVIDEYGGLRQPPIATENGDFHHIVSRDVVGRVTWHRHSSTIVGAGWTSESALHYQYPRPATLEPPFTTYRSSERTAYRNRSVSVAQALDLPVSSLAIPFIAAGVEFRSVTREAHEVSSAFNNPSQTSESIQQRTGWQQSLFASAGLRILAGRHGVVFFEALRFLTTSESELSDLARESQTESSFGALHWRWRAGVGVRF